MWLLERTFKWLLLPAMLDRNWHGWSLHPKRLLRICRNAHSPEASRGLIIIRKTQLHVWVWKTNLTHCISLNFVQVKSVWFTGLNSNKFETNWWVALQLVKWLKRIQVYRVLWWAPISRVCAIRYKYKLSIVAVQRSKRPVKPMKFNPFWLLIIIN